MHPPACSNYKDADAAKDAAKSDAGIHCLNLQDSFNKATLYAADPGMVDLLTCYIVIDFNPKRQDRLLRPQEGATSLDKRLQGLGVFQKLCATLTSIYDIVKLSRNFEERESH